MFGLGMDKSQFYSLSIDLLNVIIISAYVVHFKNPIFATGMKKVFWEFPKPFKGKEEKPEADSNSDEGEKKLKEDWDRLDDLVKK